MLVYRYTKEELEDFSDKVKASVLKALSEQAIVTQEQADEWCKSHTVVVRERNRFYSFLDKLKGKTEPANTFFIIVVKEV